MSSACRARLRLASPSPGVAAGGSGGSLGAGTLGRDLEQRLAVTAALGMTGRMAERVAAGMDPEMGTAVLKLLRSARQPAMAEAGRLLTSAAQRPGLALIAVDDFERASGRWRSTSGQHSNRAHRWCIWRAWAMVAGRDAGAGGRGADELLGRAADAAGVPATDSRR